ncbi:MAG: SDR family oxidoreductase [Rhodoferax sp.]|nr:SDR family oxidoreductase [Rhodoferax sp.]
MSKGRLQGKTVLITAAAQGIGRASAMACAAEGATVIATDVSEEHLKSLAEACPDIQVVLLDVRDSRAVHALAAQTPPLDVLFNCAGMVANGNVLDCTEADWDTSFDLNVKSMFNMTRAFLPGMLVHARNDEVSVSIINMASMASSIKGFPNRCAYGASKAAVIGMSKSIAADFVKEGVRCNALCPGTVDTPSLRGRIASAADPLQAERDFIARQPMGRLATVNDITPMVVYLASDESRFVTGQTLLVDGGVTI